MKEEKEEVEKALQNEKEEKEKEKKQDTADSAEQEATKAAQLQYFSFTTPIFPPLLPTHLILSPFIPLLRLYLSPTHLLRLLSIGLIFVRTKRLRFKLSYSN